MTSITYTVWAYKMCSRSLYFYPSVYFLLLFLFFSASDFLSLHVSLLQRIFSLQIAFKLKKVMKAMCRLSNFPGASNLISLRRSGRMITTVQTLSLSVFLWKAIKPVMASAGGLFIIAHEGRALLPPSAVGITRAHRRAAVMCGSAEIQSEHWSRRWVLTLL